MNEDLDLVGKTRTYTKEDAIKKLDDLKDILLFQQEEKRKKNTKPKKQAYRSDTGNIPLTV